MVIMNVNKGTKISWGEDYHVMAINERTRISNVTDVLEEDSVIKLAGDFSMDGNAEGVDENVVSEHLNKEMEGCSFFIDFVLYSTAGHYLVGYVGHYDTFGM